MKIELQEADSWSELSYSSWDYSFVGDSVDERGNASFIFCKNNTNELHRVSYSANDMELNFDGKSVIIDDLEDSLSFIADKKILIDGTTLNFVEILLLLKIAKLYNSRVSILYLEPKSYAQNRTNHIIHRREFELTVETPGYYPIPGFASTLNSRKTLKTIFIVGYESERVDRAIQENSVLPLNCSLVFGVPAFKPGWEMNSFANNIGIIKEHRIYTDPIYASANNPGATYDVLEMVYSSLTQHEQLSIAPLGTKPAGIAASIFLVEHDDVCVFYDHPKKMNTRTKEISKWHLYNIKF